MVVWALFFRIILRMTLLQLLFLLLSLDALASLIDDDATISSEYEYCLIGAGPAGLQLAHFLEAAKRNYVVFERADIPASFFARFPRKRRLISLNKRHTGERNDEFNLRHDWHSLLAADDPQIMASPPPKFTSYSKDNFPHADRLLDYFADFARHSRLRIEFNTLVSNVTCIPALTAPVKAATAAEGANENKKQCRCYKMSDQRGLTHKCGVVLVTTGLSKPNVPAHLSANKAVGYEDVSLDPTEYEQKTVLILGKGNSAFEVAQAIYGSTNFIHMVSRSRLRNAFSTHYVGDVRALNNQLLDTYQLKSLDGLLDLDMNEMQVVHIADKFYLTTTEAAKEKNANASRTAPTIHPSSSRVGYDKVIRCLGFRFDSELFSADMRFSKPLSGRLHKFPHIDAAYESVDYEGLYFAGALAHSLDFRKSSGGFIHGLRYTARSLFRLLEQKRHGVRWPHRRLTLDRLLHYTLRRINEASGPYQMFGHLVDVISINRELDQFDYFEEFPLQLIPRFGELSGHKALGAFIVINYEYGQNFSGPGKDVFGLDRTVGGAKFAHKSNFLHPVLYYFADGTELSPEAWHGPDIDVLKLAQRKHHMLEDLLTLWTEPVRHQMHLRRFIEAIVHTDLRHHTRAFCLRFHAVGGSCRTMPRTCARHCRCRIANTAAKEL